MGTVYIVHDYSRFVKIAIFSQKQESRYCSAFLFFLLHAVALVGSSVSNPEGYYPKVSAEDPASAAGVL